MKYPPAILCLAATAGGAVVLSRFAQRRSLGMLPGKRLAITGGTRGLGLALARCALSHGAQVVACARDGQEAADAAELLHAEFPNGVYEATAHDVTSQEAARAFIVEAVDRLGGLDLLINNAGVIQVGPWKVMNPHDFAESLNTHLWAPLYTSMAACEALHESRGRIVNIASIGGKISVPHLLPYCAGKFALVGLSEGLAVELDPLGITVTTVCPGLMRTGSPGNAWFKGYHRREYAWFSIGDSLPLLTVSAESAARRILAAAMQRRRHLVFPLPMQLAAMAHDLAPDLTMQLLTLVNRLLPAAPGHGQERRLGWESQSKWSPSALTYLNERAASSHNQTGRIP